MQKTRTVDFKLVEEQADARAQLVHNPEELHSPELVPGGNLQQTALSAGEGGSLAPSNLDMEALFREDTFWERRGRQIFNTFHFTLGLGAAIYVAATSDFLLVPATVLFWLGCLLTVQAFTYSIFHKAMLGRSDVFSLRTQKNLRRAGLVTPFVFIAVAASNLTGQMLDQSWHRGVTDVAITGQAIEVIAATAPLNSALINHLYDHAKSESLHPQALMLADRMIMFHPFDDRWKIRRLFSLAFIPGKEQEFDRLSLEYKKSMADDGFLWNTLADIAVQKQDWPLALEMANEHVRIHDKESLSYEQRAAIEKELGMTQEAEDDLAAANSVGSGH